MLYKRGDIILVSNLVKEASQLDKAVIVQADWFNIGQPPSYIVCFLNHDIYPELDFRPLISKDNKNKLGSNYQVMVDQLQSISCRQIEKKIGILDESTVKQITGCIRAILTL